MKISVIVPVYNTENYLRECLDSILNQTLQDTELFLVDDGSTDGSADIIREYAEKHPEKIQAFFKENGGQGSARNVAMQYATGEFLSFIDSDDWIDPEMYEEMVKKAEEDGADIPVELISAARKALDCQKITDGHLQMCIAHSVLIGKPKHDECNIGRNQSL